MAHVLAGILALAFAITPPNRTLDDLLLRDLSGRDIRLSDYRGRVVILDVWATWCAPCLAELPGLKRLATSYPEELAVIGISLDRLPRRDLIAWLARHGVPWTQHFDGRGFASPVARRLNIESLPVSFLIAPNGRLVATNLRGTALASAVASLAKPGIR